jgi:hypothetical protein
VVFSACPLCVALKWNKYGTLLSIEGGSTMIKLSCTLRGGFKFPVMMVHETTFGLSFQMTKGGIDDGIEDGFQTESFDNNKQKYARWASNLSDGKLRSVDGRLWQNDGSILNHTLGC